ncbi:hypothetical protein APSETT445_001165 [Aspergillus pseudonomiae]
MQDITADALQSVFGEYGSVRKTFNRVQTIPTEEETKMNKGFGFVTYSDPNEADTAVSHLDGTK